MSRFRAVAAVGALCAACSSSPSLLLSPASLTFNSGVGFDAAPQSVVVARTDGGALAWPTVSASYLDGANWLGAAVTGVSPFSLTVSPANRGLSPGTYRAQVQVASPGTGSATIAVTLRVVSPAYVESEAIPASCPSPPAVSYGDFYPAQSSTDPGTCQRPVQPSTLSPAPPGGYGSVDLGVRTVGDVVAFTAPAGTASVTIVEEAGHDGTVPGQDGTVLPPDGIQVRFGSSLVNFPNVAVPDQVRDPAHATGAPLYDDNAASPADPSGASVFFASPSVTTGVMTIPNTSAELTAAGAGLDGPWSFVVNDYAFECFQFPSLCGTGSGRNDSQYHVYVLLKQAAVPDVGTLDVAFHFVDSLTPTFGVTAAQAPDSPVVQRMVQSYAALLANAGVCVGNVIFYDTPNWARNRFSTSVNASDDPPCSNLAQLLTLSDPTQRTLDLFLLADISSSSSNGATVVGIDGTIPGPATVNGTVNAGAVVSAIDLQAGTAGCPADGTLDLQHCGPDVTAYIAAHESGHYFGLYHTTELDGASFDAAADTPHCECSTACLPSPGRCASPSFILSTRICNQGLPTCSGGRNLMFWLLGSQSAGILSPDQGRIIRSSPLLR